MSWNPIGCGPLKGRREGCALGLIGFLGCQKGDWPQLALVRLPEGSASCGRAAPDRRGRVGRGYCPCGSPPEAGMCPGPTYSGCRWNRIPRRRSSSGFPLADRFATCPGGDGKSDIASISGYDPRHSYSPRCFIPAGAWNGRELEAVGVGGRGGFSCAVFRLGSWLIRSGSSLFTCFSEDNLVPGWVGSHLKHQ